MAELDWTKTPSLETQAVAARLGRQEGTVGITLREIRGFDLALVACRRGGWARLKAAAKTHFGIEPPATSKAVQAGSNLFVWTGPEQFLVIAPRGADPIAMEIAEKLGDAASVSDQSDARCMLAISGPRVRDMLAKLVQIDLDDSVFPPGSAAVTMVDHTSVGFWRDPDDPSKYHMLCLTSYAASLWHAVVEAGAEFGIDSGSQDLPR